MWIKIDIFYKRGISVDIVSQKSDLTGYKLVIAPMLYMVEPDFIENAKTFVKNGGKLVMTYISGVVDGYDSCYLGGTPAGELKDVFGIRVEETDCVLPDESVYVEYENDKYPVYNFCEMLHENGCIVLAQISGGMYDNLPAITQNIYGKGSAYYIATRTNNEMLDKFYNDICNGIDVGFSVPDGVAIAKRGKYVFFQNFTQNYKNLEIKGNYKILNGNQAKIVKLNGYETVIIKEYE